MAVLKQRLGRISAVHGTHAKLQLHIRLWENFQQIISSSSSQPLPITAKIVFYNCNLLISTCLCEGSKKRVPVIYATNNIRQTHTSQNMSQLALENKLYASNYLLRNRLFTFTIITISKSAIFSCRLLILLHIVQKLLGDTISHFQIYTKYLGQNNKFRFIRYE